MKKSNSLKTNIQLLIIILFLSFNISCRKNVQETNSSFEVIEELIGDCAKEFELSLIENGISDSVKIIDSPNTAICYATLSYLKKIGSVLVSWEGNRINLIKTWPAYSKKGNTPFKYRKYLNVCRFGYTTP